MEEANKPIPQGTEVVETTSIRKGRVALSWNTPAPVWVKIMANTIIFSASSITGGISLIPGVSGNTVKTVAVISLIITSIAAGLKRAIGVVDN